MITLDEEKNCLSQAYLMLCAPWEKNPTFAASLARQQPVITHYVIYAGYTNMFGIASQAKWLQIYDENIRCYQGFGFLQSLLEVSVV